MHTLAKVFSVRFLIQFHYLTQSNSLFNQEVQREIVKWVLSFECKGGLLDSVLSY